MRSDRDGLGELPLAGLLDHHGAGRRSRCRRGTGLAEVAPGPGGEHLGDVDRVGSSAQQVIGVVERDAALRMLGGNKEAGGVVARSAEHTSESQSLLRLSYAVFCMITLHRYDATNYRTIS